MSNILFRIQVSSKTNIYIGNSNQIVLMNNQGTKKLVFKLDIWNIIPSKLIFHIHMMIQFTRQHRCLK